MILVTFDRCDPETKQLYRQTFEKLIGFSAKDGFFTLFGPDPADGIVYLKFEAVLSLQVIESPPCGTPPA